MRSRQLYFTLRGGQVQEEHLTKSKRLLLFSMLSAPWAMLSVPWDIIHNLMHFTLYIYICNLQPKILRMKGNISRESLFS